WRSRSQGCCRLQPVRSLICWYRPVGVVRGVDATWGMSCSMSSMRRIKVHSNAFSNPVGDPYTVLGLSRHASEAAIKDAYLNLLRQYPPERDPEQFRTIRTAYEQLRDPEQRARMDLFLVQPPPPLPKQRRPSYDLGVHVDDLLTLAMELVRTPMQDDFGEIALPSERPDGR